MSVLENEKLADGDANASDSGKPIDHRAERKLLLKLDLMLWPVFFVIYMMAFLDRINISNAAIQGMTTELHLDQGNRFNVALFVCRLPPGSVCCLLSDRIFRPITLRIFFSKYHPT